MSRRTSKSTMVAVLVQLGRADDAAFDRALELAIDAGVEQLIPELRTLLRAGLPYPAEVGAHRLLAGLTELAA